MIKKKVGEYLERAEKLKDHLSKPVLQRPGNLALRLLQTVLEQVVKQSTVPYP